MSWSDFLYNMSNINAIAGSIAGYASDRNYGASPFEASVNLGLNTAYGLVRNAGAKDIYDKTGSILGYAATTAAGYGSPEANLYGTMGLFGSALLSSPGGLFSSGGHHHHCAPLVSSTRYSYSEMFYGPYPTGYGLGPGGCYRRERFILGPAGWRC